MPSVPGRSSTRRRRRLGVSRVSGRSSRNGASYRRDFAHYYHNGMIWPFVEGYWAWAAARAETQVFGRELDALVKLSEKNNTFMELYRPEDG